MQTPTPEDEQDALRAWLNKAVSATGGARLVGEQLLEPLLSKAHAALAGSGVSEAARERWESALLAAAAVCDRAADAVDDPDSKMWARAAINRHWVAMKDEASAHGRELIGLYGPAGRIALAKTLISAGVQESLAAEAATSLMLTTNPVGWGARRLPELDDRQTLRQWAEELAPKNLKEFNASAASDWQARIAGEPPGAGVADATRFSLASEAQALDIERWAREALGERPKTEDLDCAAGRAAALRRWAVDAEIAKNSMGGQAEPLIERLAALADAWGGPQALGREIARECAWCHKSFQSWRKEAQNPAEREELIRWCPAWLARKAALAAIKKLDNPHSAPDWAAGAAFAAVWSAMSLSAREAAQEHAIADEPSRLGDTAFLAEWRRAAERARRATLPLLGSKSCALLLLPPAFCEAAAAAEPGELGLPKAACPQSALWALGRNAAEAARAASAGGRGASAILAPISRSAALAWMDASAACDRDAQTGSARDEAQWLRLFEALDERGWPIEEGEVSDADALSLAGRVAGYGCREVAQRWAEPQAQAWRDGAKRASLAIRRLGARSQEDGLVSVGDAMARIAAANGASEEAVAVWQRMLLGARAVIEARELAAVVDKAERAEDEKTASAGVVAQKTKARL
jgi:hypothetical protein